MLSRTSRLFYPLAQQPFLMKVSNAAVVHRFNIQNVSVVQAGLFRSSLLLGSLKEVSSSILEQLFNGLMLLKRTLQPSIIKKKRTHGYLARHADKDGRKVLARRRLKNRTRLC